MNQLTLPMIGVVALGTGLALGYFFRLFLAKSQIGSLEERIKNKVSQAQQEARKIVTKANERASRIIDKIEKEERYRKSELLKAEQLSLKRENILSQKSTKIDEDREELNDKGER